MAFSTLTRPAGAASARALFAANQVGTATPRELLVMLYDRLVLDLHRAEAAQREGAHGTAHDNLVHAQDIVGELLASLDVTAWDGAERLAALYGFLLTELVGANVTRDPDRTASCRSLVEPLRDAWRTAAAAGADDAVGASGPAA